MSDQEGWNIKTLKEHFEEMHKRDREALQLQAEEYERRLSDLNHEHARIAAAQQTYVSYSVLATVISLIIAAAAVLIAFFWRHQP